MIEIRPYQTSQIELTTRTPALVEVFQLPTKVDIEIKPVQTVIVVEASPQPDFNLDVTPPSIPKIEVTESNVRHIEIVTQICCDNVPTATQADSAKEITIDVVLGEDISALKFVYLDNDLAYRGDQTIKAKSQVIGILKTGGVAGSTQKALMFGRLDDPFFTFSSSQVFYLTTLGNVSATAPTTGYLKECGQGLRSGSIFINIKQTLTLIP